MVAALAVGIPFQYFFLTIGDGATPEVFTKPCAFNSRALNFTKNLNEIVVPDCNDEDAAGWIVRDPLSLSWDISGEGLLDEGSIDLWDAWFLQSETKNVRIGLYPSTTPTGNLVYQGAAHLQSFNRTANRGEFVMWNCAIMGSGPLIRTPEPAVMGASVMDSAEDTVAFMERQAARRASARAPEVKHSRSKAKDKEPA
jgi:hypothetical protein